MTLKEHIDDICDKLAKREFPNEAAVSQGIVLRLLNGLGWPIFNTQIVYPEYSVEGGNVDFALYHPGSKPWIFIEVKKVGKIKGGEDQLFPYVLDYDGVIPIAVLTDGRKWRFFHPMGVERCKEQKVRELDFIKGNSEEIADCLTRYLNYQLIRTGKAVEAIKVDYEQIVQQKQVVTWSQLMKYVEPQFRTIPSELPPVFAPLNGEDNTAFLKATWKVACIRWWAKWKEPVPSWENVEAMLSSNPILLEGHLEERRLRTLGQISDTNHSYSRRVS